MFLSKLMSSAYRQAMTFNLVRRAKSLKKLKSELETDSFKDSWWGMSGSDLSKSKIIAKGRNRQESIRKEKQERDRLKDRLSNHMWIPQNGIRNKTNKKKKNKEMKQKETGLNKERVERKRLKGK